MEYSKLLELLQQSSAYDLYRLQNELERILDDPNRIFGIKKAIHPGAVIEYYDSDENQQVKARVVSFQRTRLVVENLHDHKKFNIPYLAVNTAALTGLEDDNAMPRSQLQLGQAVTFHDSDGQAQTGEVVELGPHSATLSSAQGVWRVNYSQISSISEPPQAPQQGSRSS